MRSAANHLSIAILAMAVCIPFAAQTPLAAPGDENPATQAAPEVQLVPASPVQDLLGFRDSDVKFDVSTLMDILRDRRHEGWVLTAYPDPKTHRPLIGAGFSLDLLEREHPQRDLLNPHPFLEPSSAELWQAAGLDANRLQLILTQFNERAAMWSQRKFRTQLKVLEPEITDGEATQLLRIAAIQSIENARAYCRNFDQLSGSQQMALSQLVYQMGVNLEEFNQFLTLINSDATAASAAANGTDAAPEPVSATSSGTEYWQTVQQSLMHSQWARLYRARAVAVIAMLDPEYDDNPGAAEQRVGATLRPAVVRRSRNRRTAPRELASSTRSTSRARRRRSSRAHSKQTA